VILTHLTVDGLRSLQNIDVEPDDGLNLITGLNGSGKTSLLESIYCLSTGHSFRTRKLRELVSRGTSTLTLTAILRNRTQQQDHRLGMQREIGGKSDYRLNYEDVRSLATITQLLPVKALTPDSHRLIQEGPAGRRQFLDWGVFHVEPQFMPAWRLYQRAMQQRNRLLREQAPIGEVSSWHETLAESGVQLTQCRAAYVEQLTPVLNEQLQTMNATFHVELKFRRGWADDVPLETALETNIERCRRFKTTTIGPHRAEMSITTDGVSAREMLSRGQEKVLVIALHLAQLVLLQREQNHQAVVLCDDIAAELDEDNLHLVTQRLLTMGCQTFITSTDARGLEKAAKQWLQMEHGAIKKRV